MSSPFTAHFGHTPTENQQAFFEAFSAYLHNAPENSCFILSGYAGTGKTSCVAAIVSYLGSRGQKYVLLAPTGRAAKVLGNYTGAQALTIHKKIYRRGSSVLPGAGFTLAQNLHTNTLFVVDEASMLSNQSSGNYNSLLHDLLAYINNDHKCRLLLVGDPAQLPPVNSNESPALNADFLHRNFGIQVYSASLSQVVRQKQNSGILDNATAIRRYITADMQTGLPQLNTAGYKDVYRMLGQRLEEGIEYAYNTYGSDNVILITRSNKGAIALNNYIRGRLLFRDEEITSGDKVMVVKNNYHWLPENTYTDFIANGDTGKLLSVGEPFEKYGFTFANARLKLDDYPDLAPVTCKLLITTLQADTPSLSAADNELLYQRISESYSNLKTARARADAVKNDPYFNALQVKHAYAVTCHKAQGGQWQVVFVDQGYVTEEMLDVNFYRWLYTAITRARSKLFLVNFSDIFFTPQSTADN